MFKSITYLRHDQETNFFIYNFMDTDFECEVALDMAVPGAADVVLVAVEYQKKKYTYQEIVKNLFRCNLYLCNEYKSSFEDILEWQHKYTDKYFKNANFNEKYYDKLKTMWDKYKLFL